MNNIIENPSSKYCHVVNIKNQKYDIYIGRGSKWGNPFKMKNNSKEERNRVCDNYEKYFFLLNYHSIYMNYMEKF